MVEPGIFFVLVVPVALVVDPVVEVVPVVEEEPVPPICACILAFSASICACCELLLLLLVVPLVVPLVVDTSTVLVGLVELELEPEVLELEPVVPEEPDILPMPSLT